MLGAAPRRRLRSGFCESCPVPGWSVSRTALREVEHPCPKEQAPYRDNPLSLEAQRWWPRPIPSMRAFWRRAPSVRFMARATFFIGVRFLECILSSRQSALVHSRLRIGFSPFASLQQYIDMVAVLCVAGYAAGLTLSGG